MWCDVFLVKVSCVIILFFNNQWENSYEKITGYDVGTQLEHADLGK